MILKGAAQYLTIIILQPPFQGHNKYMLNNFKDATAMRSGLQSNNLIMLATPFMKQMIINQQKTSQTSMLWTCKLS
jgi:hypothetical protein